MASAKLNFHILIDEGFEIINDDNTMLPIDNKRVLSLLNDFEDGKWRYDKFQNFILDHIAESSLSERERSSLVNHTLLKAAAKNLRLTDKAGDNSQGSELAEILLYAIMRKHYGALPVVPKIFYKQNTNDPAKGADSVHIVIEGENEFSVWLGEAKFYNSIENARLDKIVDSIEESLDLDKLKKEKAIVSTPFLRQFYFRIFSVINALFFHSSGVRLFNAS